MTSARIASSSRPISSMSSAVRWAIGLSVFFCMTVMVLLRSVSLVGQWSMSQGPAAAETQVWIEDAVAGRGGGDLAGAQVAHGALAQRQDAAEADAHPAPGRHQHAGLLAGVEDRGGAVGLDGRAGAGERDGAAVAGDDDARRGSARCAALGTPRSSQCSSSASSSPAGPQAQVSRSARSGTRSSRSATSSTPCASVCCSTSRMQPVRGERAQLVAEDRRRRRDVHRMSHAATTSADAGRRPGTGCAACPSPG